MVLKNTKRFIWLLLTLLAGLANAQSVYVASSTKEPVRFGNKFLFLLDSTTTMTLDEALSSDKFKPNTDDIPNYDVTKDAVWGKIKLTCKEAADWYLFIYPSSYDEIVFYQKRGSGPWQKQALGCFHTDIPETDNLQLKLDLVPGDTTLFLFRTREPHPIQLDLKIGTLDSFIVPSHITTLYNGLCFGVMLMMLIYNLYLYVVQRERAYIYYVLYIFCNSCFLANFSGYFFHLPHFIQSIILWDPVFFPVTFGIFLVFFMLRLLKGFIPEGWKRVIFAFMVLITINGVIGAVGSKYLAFNFIRISGLLLGLICVTTGIIAYRRGSSSAKFFIMGFGIYLGGLAFLILSGHIIPANSVALMVLLTTSAAETVLLSFAQADKLKVLQLEKEKAQLDALARAKENEHLVKEQNIVLEQKVKERTAALEEKNKEVMDSIHYAKRIQNALLAQEDILRKFYQDRYFLLFKPKDIVSGDFYWGCQQENRIYLAVCDCTGHGVPGAFMSLLNTSYLNEAIIEKNIAKPNEIFNYVRDRLVTTISHEGGRDGMDGILFCKDLTTNKITYAAAYNTPYLVRKGALVELQTDKMPVGRGELDKSFTNFDLKLEQGDGLYLLTDGYADQFGGPKGKKFKYKQLEDILISMSHLPMSEQKIILEQKFNEWKEGFEQVDDVCIIGISTVSTA
jgi:serine phosphatase RsbU (regulator of sigma subunit)